MSWEDENIDKLFQEASANSSFEFKEEYWKEMEAMLPKKKKRRFPFLWTTSALTGCVIIATILFSKEDNKILVSKNLLASKNDNSSISNENKNPESDNISNSKTDEEISKNSTIKPKSKKQDHKLRTEKPILSVITNFKETEEHHSYIGNEIIPYSTIIKEENKEVITSDKVNYLSLTPFPANIFNYDIKSGLTFKSSPKKWLIYFDASTSIGQSMIRSNSNGSNLTKGFGLATGISYLTKNWTFSAGIATTFSVFDNLIIKERAKVYGFGIKNYENNMAYNQIYSFETPLMIGLKQKNHIIQFGIVPTYLIGSKMSFESKENNETPISSTLYGYSKGLINLGLKPTLGYIYKITPSLLIGGNVQLQLFSQIETNVFEGAKNSLPLNAQFFIRKTIFIKR